LQRFGDCPRGRLVNGDGQALDEACEALDLVVPVVGAVVEPNFDVSPLLGQHDEQVIGDGIHDGVGVVLEPALQRVSEGLVQLRRLHRLLHAVLLHDFDGIEQLIAGLRRCDAAQHWSQQQPGGKTKHR